MIIRFSIGLILVFVGLLACTTKQANEKKELTVNPPSEMAGLMLAMEQNAEQWKGVFTTNAPKPSAFPEIDKLFSAKLTPGFKRDEFFLKMAASYTKAYEDFVSEPTIEGHNVVVGNCISCHQQACTGPLVRIEKLLIKN